MNPRRWLLATDRTCQRDGCPARVETWSDGNGHLTYDETPCPGHVDDLSPGFPKTRACAECGKPVIGRATWCPGCGHERKRAQIRAHNRRRKDRKRDHMRISIGRGKPGRGLG